MDRAELLRVTVAEFLKVEPRELHAGSPLVGRRLESSLGRAALDAAIRRRLDVQCPAVYSVRTYGDLEAAILGKPEPEKNHVSVPVNGQRHHPLPISSAGAAQRSDGRAVACGIDLEPISSFPAVPDYWEDALYRNNFTAREISYCLLQRAPAMHFAARWCAKEALKKCDNRFLREPMRNLELAADESGAPQLSWLEANTRQVLPFAVSVAHTAEFAVAVVVGLSLPEPTPLVQPPPPVPPVAAPVMKPRTVWVLELVLLAMSLVLAGWAFLRTF